MEIDVTIVSESPEINVEIVGSGPPGQDGFSPIVSTENIENGTRVTITDKNGPHSFDVMNGKDGQGGGGGDFPYTFGPTLKVTGNTLDVNTSENIEQDNTLPITSAAVYATVGNIEILLETI